MAALASLDIDVKTPACVVWKCDDTTQCLTKADPTTRDLLLEFRFDSSTSSASLAIHCPIRLKGIESHSSVIGLIAPNTIASFAFRAYSNPPAPVRDKLNSNLIRLRLGLYQPLRLVAPIAASEPVQPRKQLSSKICSALCSLTGVTALDIYVSDKVLPSIKLKAFYESFRRSPLKPFDVDFPHTLASLYRGSGGKFIDDTSLLQNQPQNQPPPYDELDFPPPSATKPTPLDKSQFRLPPKPAHLDDFLEPAQLNEFRLPFEHTQFKEPLPTPLGKFRDPFLSQPDEVLESTRLNESRLPPQPSQSDELLEPTQLNSPRLPPEASKLDESQFRLLLQPTQLDDSLEPTQHNKFRPPPEPTPRNKSQSPLPTERDSKKRRRLSDSSIANFIADQASLSWSEATKLHQEMQMLVQRVAQLEMDKLVEQGTLVRRVEKLEAENQLLGEEVDALRANCELASDGLESNDVVTLELRNEMEALTDRVDGLLQDGLGIDVEDGIVFKVTDRVESRLPDGLDADVEDVIVRKVTDRVGSLLETGIDGEVAEGIFLRVSDRVDSLLQDGLDRALEDGLVEKVTDGATASLLNKNYSLSISES